MPANRDFLSLRDRSTAEISDLLDCAVHRVVTVIATVRTRCIMDE